MFNRFNEEEDDARSLTPLDELIAAARQNGQIDKVGDPFLPSANYDWAHANYPPGQSTDVVKLEDDFHFQDLMDRRVRRFANLRQLLERIPIWDGEWIVAFGSLCDPLAELTGTPVLMTTHAGRTLDIVWSKDLLWVKRFQVLCAA